MYDDSSMCDKSSDDFVDCEDTPRPVVEDILTRADASVVSEPCSDAISSEGETHTAIKSASGGEKQHPCKIDRATKHIGKCGTYCRPCIAYYQAILDKSARKGELVRLRRIDIEDNLPDDWKDNPLYDIT